MSVATASKAPCTAAPAAHPNELDQRRIERSLKQRKRYRYVEPSVMAAPHGYLIRSACCSRRIDPDGGPIDIALIQWQPALGEWVLQAKDHASDCWQEESRYARLPELLLRLNFDPEKRFWQ